MRRRRGWRVPVAIATVLVVAAAVSITVVEVHDAHVRAERKDQAAAQRAADDFLAAWSKQDATAMAALATPATSAYVSSEVPQLKTSLQITSATFRGQPVVRAGRTASTPVGADVVVQGLGTWTYQTTLQLQKVDHAWKVDFTPQTVEPQLGPGDTIVRARQLGTRGVLTDAAGSSLRGRSAELDGNLLGAVGKVTEAQATALGAGFEAGDVAGISGLERAYNTQLGGTPGGSLTIRAASGATVATLLSKGVTNGTNVALSIDLHTQLTAQSALTSVVPPGQIGSLVALDMTTGKVLALANDPVNGFGYAVRGQFPPGSTFKIITTAAAVLAGKGAGTPLPCEQTATVDGRVFKNAENEAYGTIPLSQAFAVSCNTAFVTLASQLPMGSLTSAAQLFGMSPDPLDKQTPPLPIASFGGSVPTATDLADQAGESIGQGRVLVSPLQMASVAAAIGSGTWHQPYVTATPPAGAKSTTIPPAVVSAEQGFMSLVVSEGTAAGVGLPSGTRGKTGTAEYGNDNPLKTIAWFVGFRGNIAFACQVGGGAVSGGFGADSAAPVVRQFLDSL